MFEETYDLHQCLFRRNPDFSELPARCGNGLIDKGEDCDCSEFPDAICSSHCCRNCKFIMDAECSTGLCCDLNTCLIKPVGSVCRPKQDECDLEDKCEGKSSLCRDFYNQDGSMCTVIN
ncbi:hypothetical protein HELRODRAFT_87418 [Helobdella robusta]|uniref:Disintegrin domain-containing protein n=1 Tax=Helobdella robusta TaxID=6412 RepID=T1G6P7_HELRO|nr:hypothetical protein HELRODRAFT_87418 [Helobdella robusta]ESN94919.1 hypothetical protein HELRODRAFT_87418 [Helobdella robusta]